MVIIESAIEIEVNIINLELVANLVDATIMHCKLFNLLEVEAMDNLVFVNNIEPVFEIVLLVDIILVIQIDVLRGIVDVKLI